MNNMSIDGKLLLESGEQEPDSVSIEAFERFADVDLTLFAIIDQRRISVPELLQLEPGQLLPLTRPAGENIDLFIGDVLIGSAEILVTDEKVAVRVAELSNKPAVARGISNRE
jgi:flagellar motor switch/type III secretory pathway protein FliN